jgi:predicted RNase H-like HicB family nuclease
MEVSMVEIQPIRVEIEREDDGRILASVPDLPGVMAYGGTEDEAIRKVKSIALQVLADMIESGEDVSDWDGWIEDYPRQQEAIYPASEYFRFNGLQLEHMDLAMPEAIAMHP